MPGHMSLRMQETQGRLRLRPIHGDPKVNNIMMDIATGQAVSIVDLDTVKPGLVHYDIGDCLRSGCNPTGRRNRKMGEGPFRHRPLQGHPAGLSLNGKRVPHRNDFSYIYDSIRLIAFELGLRFFTDYLEGDVYFKVRRPGTQSCQGACPVQTHREYRITGNSHPQHHPGDQMNGRNFP